MGHLFAADVAPSMSNGSLAAWVIGAVAAGILLLAQWGVLSFINRLRADVDSAAKELGGLKTEVAELQAHRDFTEKRVDRLEKHDDNSRGSG